MQSQQQYRRYEGDLDYSLSKIRLEEMTQYDSRLASLQEENQRLSQRLNRVELQLDQLLRNPGSYNGKYYNNDYSDPSDPIGYMQAVRDRERKRIMMEQGRWDSSMISQRYSKYPYDDPTVENPGLTRRKLSVLDQRDAVKPQQQQQQQGKPRRGIPKRNTKPVIDSDNEKGSDDEMIDMRGSKR